MAWELLAKIHPAEPPEESLLNNHQIPFTQIIQRPQVFTFIYFKYCHSFFYLNLLKKNHIQEFINNFMTIMQAGMPHA